MTRRDHCMTCGELVGDSAPSCAECCRSYCEDCFDQTNDLEFIARAADGRHLTVGDIARFSAFWKSDNFVLQWAESDAVGNELSVADQRAADIVLFDEILAKHKGQPASTVVHISDSDDILHRIMFADDVPFECDECMCSRVAKEDLVDKEAHRRDSIAALVTRCEQAMAALAEIKQELARIAEMP